RVRSLEEDAAVCRRELQPVSQQPESFGSRQVAATPLHIADRPHTETGFLSPLLLAEPRPEPKTPDQDAKLLRTGWRHRPCLNASGTRLKGRSILPLRSFD